MRPLILKRPAAERDIEECFVFIAEDNVDIGITFLVAVENSLDRLSEFPLIGKAHEFQGRELSSLRAWPVKGFEGYLIFYLVADTGIEVVRVLHTSRDIDSLFSD